MRFTLPHLLPGALLALLPLAATAQEADLAGPVTGPVTLATGVSAPLPTHSLGDLLYDNGPLVNSVGTGPLGEDESILQNTSLGMTINGFNMNRASGFRFADDFIVPSPGWNVNEIVFYGYQTGATPDVSSFTAVYVQIWNGMPDTLGSVVVYGDTLTNRLTSSEFANIYRRAETAPGAVNRPVMRNVTSVDVTLPPGTYWLEWSAEGSINSGPWNPPITITGQTTTGNARQFSPNDGMWHNVIDAGASTTETWAQGMPFQIYGQPATANEEGPRVPGEFALAAPAPNPATAAARVAVEVERAQALRVAVYDALGREVATLHEGLAAVGRLDLVLDAQALPSGVYLVRAAGETGTVSARLTVAR